jgi:signal transduction histidine kinase/ActR/RegA family two-component response regulator
MDLHPTLKRQLKRVGADENQPPSAEAWQALLTRINNAYQGADQERYVLERSLNISSNEMQKLYENLKRSSESAINQEKNKLLSILTSLADGVLETDTAGKILYANPTAQQLLAIDDLPTNAHHLLDFFTLHQTDQTIIENPDQLSNLLSQSQGFRDDNALVCHHSASKLAVSFALSPIKQDNLVSGYVITFRDMSLQKAAEEELRNAKQLAEDAAETKANFLATMSHEIRTPLNGVIGIATLLADTDLDAMQLDYVSTLRRSAEVLLSLINDILDFSKMDAGKLTLESIPFAPTALIHDLHSMFQSQFEQKKLKASYHLDDKLPTCLLGDEHRLRQVLINLVGNALKFTEKGEVNVSVKLVGVLGNQCRVRFSVQDTGIGISATAQARLFEAFTQADGSTTRQFGGTGLGLSISKKIIELMHGKLQLASTLGEGSRFFFDIMLTKTDSPISIPSHATVNTPVSVEGKKLLLVEDNKINQLVAGKLLEKFGYAYDIAENGIEAVDKASSNHYDAILMDCQMPVLDGFEATKRIRQSEQAKSAHTPIIGLTANALEGDREKCLACGMDDFTTKPIKLEELASKLNYWCQAKTPE